MINDEQEIHGWRDIVSAPKNKTEVLGCYVSSEYGIVYGPWTMTFEKRQWIPTWEGSSVIEYMCDFGIEYRDLPLQPTHWMPLPSLPPVK